MPRGVREGLTRKENAHRVYRRKAEYIWRHKATRGCADCGLKDPVVLDLDHRDPSTKLATMRDNRNSYKRNFPNLGWDTLMEEIEKCDVVCANCHRRRTAAMFGWAVSG